MDEIKLIESKSVAVGASSPEVNFVRDLVYNKNKDNSIFVCEGLWAVEKLIAKQIEVLAFYLNAEGLKEEKKENLAKIAKIANYAKKVYAVSSKTCKKISDRDGFDEYFIVAKLKLKTLKDIEEKYNDKENVLAIIMDGLEQPGNIGSILRSFDCAGGDFAIITNKQAKLNNSRLVRASLGASFMLDCLEEDIDVVQKWLEKNNYKCMVTDLTATKNFKEADYLGKVAIISGNEHTGISPSWRKLKNSQSIIIPMLGSCESLNVGFASTLVAYEAGLQKFKNVKY